MAIVIFPRRSTLTQSDISWLKGEANFSQSHSPNTHAFSSAEIEKQAATLAGEHQIYYSREKGKLIYRRFKENILVLNKIYFTLADSAQQKELLPPGAEWLLDNHHVIEEQVNEIKRDFPKSYYLTLPKLKSGPLAGFPRVAHVALDAISLTNSIVDRSLLTAFTHGYQSHTALTIGELWAVPIMLRLALIENLRGLAGAGLIAKFDRDAAEKIAQTVFSATNLSGTDTLLNFAEQLKRHDQLGRAGQVHLIRALRSRGTQAALALRWFEEKLTEAQLDPQELIRSDDQAEATNQISIGNAITSLKSIGRMNWQDWFESVSTVESILRQDPNGVYAQSDFTTRDRCRSRIELLARMLKKHEPEIAQAAVRAAHTRLGQVPPGVNAEEYTPRLGHVGYYLIDRGLREFERELGFAPSLIRRTRRTLKNQALPLYLLSIGLITGLILLLLGQHLLALGVSLKTALCFGTILLIPISHVALELVNWRVTRLLAPSILPKLEFKKDLPINCKTVVTVHAIFNNPDAVSRAVEQLEVRFLGNEDPQIYFALLCDLHDAASETLASDESLTTHAKILVAELNLRYFPEGAGRFFLFFRARRWNASEKTFMGWERKRGKIMEFNHFLLTGDYGTFSCLVGDAAKLRGTDFVITLDGDTQLPRGTAKTMIAALAHPLNKAVFDEQINLVRYGYTVIQPRVGPSLTSAAASIFASISSGNAGLDPYTQSISDVYQDLFAEGSYIGKGIYRVSDFERALSGHVPENALLSHDLFEGLFGRVALATDILLLDDCPTTYQAHAKRAHRWTRGDWQLFPWIFPRVPNAQGKKIPNPLNELGIWKILDNFRRSLTAPFTFLFLICAWIWLPAAQIPEWEMLAVLISAVPLLLSAVSSVRFPENHAFGSHLRATGIDLWRQFKLSLFNLTLLPYRALKMTEAISLTLWRVYISRRHLLVWQTADEVERKKNYQLLDYYWEMFPAWLLSATILSALLYSGRTQIGTLVFSGAWLLTPAIAYLISRPIFARKIQLNLEDETYLRNVGWETWGYFAEHLTKERNFLIPDNLQLVPTEKIAERTSPTNISLSILSVISAYDLGFNSLPGTIALLKNIYATLERLQKFNGHLLNWYHTLTLEPLHPLYVSTVDSGNLAGHLIAAREAYADFMEQPLLGRVHLKHRLNNLEHLKRSIKRLPERLPKFLIFEALLKDISNPQVVGASRPFEGLRQLALQAQEFSSTLRSLEVRTVNERAAQLTSANELEDFSRTFETYFSWLPAIERLKQVLESSNVPTAPSKFLELINTALTHDLEDLTPIILVSLLGDLEFEGRREDTARFFKQRAVAAEQQLFDDALGKIETVYSALTVLLNDLAGLQTQSAEIVEKIDFGFLFDAERKLFVIGYQVDSGKKDSGYYDLLASEARLTSLVAIAKDDIPQQHWFLLARALTKSSGGPALLSWSATMFEYLMPLLVTKSYPDTILSRTYQAVVAAQKAYGKQKGLPWGVSESGYSGVDFEKTYQYKAFGVPGLGLKRGLSEDMVVSPYSTFLAIDIDPLAAISNARRLEDEGCRGRYGFYEAVDFTPERLSSEETKSVVQSFLAHHQGMTLAAINNFLNDDIFQNRFHRDPAIESVELLLQERFPHSAAMISPHQAELTMLRHSSSEDRIPRGEMYFTPHTTVPRTRVLSNGRMTTMIDNAGSGFVNFGSDGITAWREDAVSNDTGYYIYLRDLDFGEVWSTTYQPTQVEPQDYTVVFDPDRVEFGRRDFDLSVRTEIVVSPEDNVEVRRVTLTNLANRMRNIEITSFAEVVLGSRRAFSAHPAFAKMFVQSEYLFDYDGLLFSRRPRSKHETPLFVLHMLTMKRVWHPTEYESSRAEFIGRGRSVHAPQALESKAALKKTTGMVIDPCFSLRTRIELQHGETEALSFITIAANTREEVIKLAQRYHDLHTITRAFEMAWSQSDVELRHEQFNIAQAHAFQHLANALFFNVPALRAESAQLRANRLPQSGFWRFGISGDFPIVVLRIDDARQYPFVQELLLAHAYLRMRGIAFDLVVLNEEASGYFQDLQDGLQKLVGQGPSAAYAEKHGGIYLRSMAQLSAKEVTLLLAQARVVLRGAGRSLIRQLTLKDELKRDFSLSLPRSSFIESYEKPYLSPKVDLEFANDMGGFTDDGRVYTIQLHNNVSPPRPWSNVIANPGFGFLVSERGGGYTWSENSRENRLTPWSNDAVSDPPGEMVYLREVESGAYWSATPARTPLRLNYTVRHGFGFSEFDTQVCGVFSRLTMSISPNENEKVKYWHLHLLNGDVEEKTIELYFYLDLTLGILREESFRSIQTEFDQNSRVLYAQNWYNNEFAGRYVYLGASEPITSYTTKRTEFIGRNRSAAAPRFLENGVTARRRAFPWGVKDELKLSNAVGVGHDPCGVISVTVHLKPREEKDLCFFLGETGDFEAMRANAKNYRRLATRNESFEQTFSFWQKELQAISVSTPDRSFDVMVNGWLQYQNLSCRIFGRSGFYQSGGAFGFRDQLQDSLALLYTSPERTRAQILLHASRQFKEGDVQHWWHPPTGRGVRTRISDDYLWLPYAVARYIDVTGDSAILDENIGFVETELLKPEEHEKYLVPENSERKASLYEHCLLAINYGLTEGPHGLPLIGAGDWNDGMNEVGTQGRGESVWLGWFLLKTLKDFGPLLAARNETAKISEYEAHAKKLHAAIEREAWDGAWYRRAFFDDGTPMGSAANDECQIDSLAQTWSVISEAGDKKRALEGMESAYQRLVDEPNGIIQLLNPPFDRGNLSPGYIKGYPPGVRENGGQYTHAATWMVLASTLLGRGGKAFQLFQLINPIKHGDSAKHVQTYQTEPYVLCGDVYSVPPHVGRGGWSWYTGSAGWMYRVATENILGLKVKGGRFLTLEPCIPASWKNFSLTYQFKNTRYEFRVENPQGLESGRCSLEIDGAAQANDQIDTEQFTSTTVLIRAVLR